MGKACFESRAGIAGHGLFLECDVLNLLMSNPLFFFFFKILKIIRSVRVSRVKYFETRIRTELFGFFTCQSVTDRRVDSEPLVDLRFGRVG